MATLPVSAVVSNEVELLFFFPFWISLAPAPVAPLRRRDALEKWSAALNEANEARASDEYTQRVGTWSVEQFQAWAPIMVRSGKFGVLRREWRNSTHLLGVARTCFASAVDASGTSGAAVISVTETVRYYDYGLGTSSLQVKVRLSSGEQLAKLYRFAIEFHDAISEPEQRDIVRHWSSLRAELLRGFSCDACQVEYPLESYWLAGDGAGDPDGKLLVYAMGLLLREAHDGLRVTTTEMEVIAEEFCGQSCDPGHMQTVHSEVPLSWQGFNGAFALTRDELVAERVRWLWQLNTIHLAALFDATVALQERYSAMRTQDWWVDDPERQLGQLQSARTLLSQIALESLPVYFCGDALDETIYRKMWEAWRGPEFLAAFEKQAAVLDAAVDDLKADLLRESEKRTQIGLTLIAALTIVSVACDVIGAWDYKDPRSFEKGLRLFLLFVIAMSVALWWGHTLKTHKRGHGRSRISKTQA